MAKRREKLLTDQDVRDFQSRLREIMGTESEAKFAERAGISQSGLNRILNGGTPAMDILIAIAVAGGVRVEWLATGKLPKSHTDGRGLIGLLNSLTDELRNHTSPHSADDTQDFVVIPAYDHRYSAGPGAALALEDAEPNHEMAFSRQWLRRLGINPDRAILAYADGDSMWPTIADRAPMVIDTSIQEVRHGFIYAFNLDGYLIVKRINHRIDGSIELISDNREKYPPQIVDRNRLDQMHVIGRVYLAVQQL